MNELSKYVTNPKNRVRCAICGKEKAKNDVNFYKRNKDIITTHLLVCKKPCIDNLYLKEDGTIDKEEFKMVLKMLNRPFVEKIFQKMLKANKVLGEYLQMVSIDPNCIGKEWEHSDKEFIIEQQNEEYNSLDVLVSKDDDTSFELTANVINFWGKIKNGTIEDYEYLEHEFYQWINKCSCNTYAEEVLIKSICKTQLAIRKDEEQGEDTSKKTVLLQQLMTSSGLKPNDKNKENKEEDFSLGKIIKDIEKYQPSEYFERRKQYTDFDKFKKYIDLWMLRPMRNLLANNRDFDVKDELKMLGEQNEKK